MDRGGGSHKARILIVDDKAFMRVAIRALLARDAGLEVVGEAGDGHAAIARCEELEPDMILMDVSMPGMGGIEATRQIKKRFPRTSVLILTAHADHRLLLDAVKAGAAGYVLKGDDINDMLDAVRAVLNGETPLDQDLVMKLLRGLGEEADAGAEQQATLPAKLPPRRPSASSKTHAPLSNPLTLRETEVLGYLAKGKTNRQIARELHLSLSTVKRHLERIIYKLEVSDRTQAAVKAIEMGLLAERTDSR